MLTGEGQRESGKSQLLYFSVSIFIVTFSPFLRVYKNAYEKDSLDQFPQLVSC